MWFLIAEHCYAYLSGIFRQWEIKTHGKSDIYGIVRAPKEVILKTFEVFFDCLIFGYTMNHMTTLTWDEF
jgi:hypothetical protein